MSLPTLLSCWCQVFSHGNGRLSTTCPCRNGNKGPWGKPSPSRNWPDPAAAALSVCVCGLSPKPSPVKRGRKQALSFCPFGSPAWVYTG